MALGSYYAIKSDINCIFTYPFYLVLDIWHNDQVFFQDNEHKFAHSVLQETF